jgi:hypothetical protein
MMNAFLKKVLAAHGGLDRWHGFDKIEATIVTNGAFWAMKGIEQDQDPRQATVWLKQERSTVGPFGDPDWHSDFIPGRVAILRGDGSLVAERETPRASFAGHQQTTAWDPLHRAYFNGYALWTYLSSPFLLAMDGVEISEIEPWTEAGETWRVLKARFPQSVATHSAVQHFYFGADLLLRRHDYDVDVAGGFGAAQLVSNYIEAGGIRLPSRRRAYTRGPAREVNPDPLMVSIDIGDVRFS